MKQRYFFNVLLLFIIFSAVNSILIYYYFSNYIYESNDFAVHINYIWNLVYNGKLYDSFFGHSPLRHHFDIIEHLFGPVYILFKNFYSILCIKGIFVYSSAIALFLICTAGDNTKIPDNYKRKAGILISLIFLFHYYINYNIRTESGSLLMIPFFLWGIYFHKIKKYKLFVLFLIFSALTRENIALIIAFFFLTNSFVKKKYLKRQTSLAAFIICILGFIFIIKFLQPQFGSQFESDRNKYFSFYAHLGNSYSEIFQTFLKNPFYILKLILNPHKISFILFISLSAGLFPILFSRYLIIILIFYLQFAISSQEMSFFNYTYYFLPVIPFIFLALIEFVLSSRHIKYRLLFLLTLLFLNIYFFIKMPLFNSFFINEKQIFFQATPKNIIDDALKLIGNNQSAMTSLHLRIYIADRDKVHRLHLYNINEDIVLLDLSEPYFFAMSPYIDKQILSSLLLKKLWYQMNFEFVDNPDKISKNYFYKIKYFKNPILVLEKNDIKLKNLLFSNSDYIFQLNQVKKIFEESSKRWTSDKLNYNKSYQKNYIPYFNYLRAYGENQMLADDLIIANNSFYSTNKVLKIKINNSLEIRPQNNNDINYLKLELKNLKLPDGLNKIHIEITGSEYSETCYMPVFIDSLKPEVRFKNANNKFYFYYTDVSKVTVKYLSEGKYYLLTNKMIDKNSVFYDKLYFTDSDSSEEFYEENYNLKKNGYLTISDRIKWNSIIFSDASGNQRVIQKIFD